MLLPESTYWQEHSLWPADSAQGSGREAGKTGYRIGGQGTIRTTAAWKKSGLYFLIQRDIIFFGLSYHKNRRNER